MLKWARKYSTDDGTRALNDAQKAQNVVKKCAGSGRSDIITLMAASNALQCVIHSVYPPLNGLLDPRVALWNRVATPKGYDASGSSRMPTLKVMWFTKDIRPDVEYCFDTCVPLVRCDVTEEEAAVDEELADFEALGYVAKNPEEKIEEVELPPQSTEVCSENILAYPLQLPSFKPYQPPAQKPLVP